MATDIHTVIQKLKSGLEELQEHFEHLGSIFGGAERAATKGRKAKKARFRTNTSRADPYKNFKFRAKKGRKGQAKASSPVKKARKKTTMSPALKKQRQMQGKYMALVRRLSKAKQAQVKMVRKEQGYEAALKAMA